MLSPRTRPLRLPAILALGTVLSGGGVACGGVVDGGILGAADGGGEEARLGGDTGVSVDAFVRADVAANASACEEGLNTSYPPAECSGPSDYWLASPYQPDADITVQTIEIHTMSGSVALLANGGSGPGAVLFVGSVPAQGAPGWLGASVSPAVSLKGGELYYLAFEGSYCSQAEDGPEAIEYGSGSLDGPWTVTGTDNWTARMIGTCP
jgi:hypothetical protein